MKTLCRKLTAFDTLTIALQDLSATLAETKTFSDAVSDKHSNMRHRLGQAAGAVENAKFESDTVKLENKKELNVQCERKIGLKETTVNKRRTSELKDETRNNSNSLHFAYQALYRRHFEDTIKIRSSSLDLRFISATSNLCEYLFPSLVVLLVTNAWHSSRQTLKTNCFCI